MRIRCLKSLFVAALALGAQRAWAFLDPPYITPANPVAGDIISVDIYGGGCDVVDDGFFWPPPVDQQGNELTILFTGIHEEDPEFCYYGIGTAMFPLGNYPAGSYTLQVERRYMGIPGPWVQETLGIIPFTVTGAPLPKPVDAPTLNIIGLGCLLLMLIVLAWSALCVRKAR